MIEMLYPDFGAIVNSTSVTFRWEGKANSIYELYCSTDPDLADCDPIIIEPFNFLKSTPQNLNLLISGILITGFLGILRRRILFILLTVLVVILILLSCSQNSTSPSDNDIIEFSQTVENLEPNTTYYWKIIAYPEGTDNFLSETVTYSFTTND